MSALRRGSIVWAALPDPQGRNPKRRPAVVVSDRETSQKGTVDCVAVSTSVPDPPPADCVALPWDSHGRTSTRLRRRCLAVCSWAVTVAADQVEHAGGYVPADVMRRILELVEKIERDRGANP